MNDNNLEKILKESYEIQINNITKNSDSTDGNVYLIKSENCKYIFKIYNNLEHTQSMINLHNFLNENNLYVPRIIQTKNKEYYKKYNDKYIVMYSFLEGSQLKNIIQTVDNKTISKLAKEIRRLHDLTENVTFNLKYIDFNLDEAKVIQDENGKAIDIQKRLREDGEKLIEDFMISANECVATHIYNMDLPFIYRVHESPKPEKIEEFLTMIKLLGYKTHTSLKNITPHTMQNLLAE